MSKKQPLPSQVPAVTTKKELESAAKQRALDMYLSHNSVADIARVLNVGTVTITRWKKQGDWAIQREESDRALLEDTFATRKLTIARIAQTSAEQVHRGLKYIAERPEPPSVQETERIASILANLDKINRLDMGKSTDNVAVAANVKVSIDEIRKIVSSDPFFEEVKDE